MKNSYGTALSLSIFGESHGSAIGAVLDGLAPGIPINRDFIAGEMDKRRARGATSTARREADEVEFLSGVHEHHTTGAPLCLIIKNSDTKSEHYLATKALPRPGHADYAAFHKYFGLNDIRGGGHFSGRITAAFVAAGAICHSILMHHGILVGSHIARCAGIADIPLPTDEASLKTAIQQLNSKTFAVLNEDAGERMQGEILRAKEDGDSVGGILETAVVGLCPGVGEPFFESVESVLSALLFSIPAVKGVEFGLGFGFADERGSSVCDELVPSTQKGGATTLTNCNGGITGGITTGMPIVVRCVVKPTPSISRPLRTVDFERGTAETLATKGRHDPCIVHRARAVADAAVAFGILDLFCQRYGTLWQNPELK